MSLRLRGRRGRCTFTTSLLLGVIASSELHASDATVALPRWAHGLSGIKIVSPDMDYQSVVEDVNNKMRDAQFSSERFALLFTQGSYPELKMVLGYYTSIIGAADLASKVRLPHVYSVNGLVGGATQNFWRSVEGVTLTDSFNVWAVSQAAPMRRTVVEGDLYLSDNGGWSSGGFLADVAVHGVMDMGTQQQWFSRNMDFGEKGVKCPIGWNYVFMGVNGFDKDACQADMKGKIVQVPRTPRIAEKPYIVLEDDGVTWNIHVPGHEGAGLGGRPTGSHVELGKSPPIDRKLNLDTEVFVARPEHTPQQIQEGIKNKKGLLFTPWVFVLPEPINITKDGFVVLGIGMATLTSVAGKSALQVADGLEDVRIAGLLLEAGTPGDGPGADPSLLRWGTPGMTWDLTGMPRKLQSLSLPTDKPGVLSDIFARVAALQSQDCRVVSVDNMLEINSNNVIIDNTWLWHADHDDCGRDSDKCYTKHGLVVNGDNVTSYGLAVEHIIGGDMVKWNGEGGEVFFYQSELPYHNNGFFDNNYAGYAVAPHVKKHIARGCGVYIIGETPIEAAYRVSPSTIAQHLVTVVIQGEAHQFRHTVCFEAPDSDEYSCLKPEDCDDMRCVLGTGLAAPGLAIHAMATELTVISKTTATPSTTHKETTSSTSASTAAPSPSPTFAASGGTSDKLVNCNLEVLTSKQVLAETKSGVMYSVYSNGLWAEEEMLTQFADMGEAVEANFPAMHIPEKLRLRASGGDAYGYKRIRLTCNGEERMIVDSVNGDVYGNNRFWVDATGGALAPSSQEFEVPTEPPFWRIYAHYDYSSVHDAEHMDASNLEAVQQRVMEKGYVGFALNLGMAFLKSGDRLLTKEDLVFKGEASPVDFFMVARRPAVVATTTQAPVLRVQETPSTTKAASLESMVFGDSHPLGTAMKPERTLDITIVKAVGLAQGDWLGGADPYCAVFSISPETQREIYAFRTNTMHDSQQPEWGYRRGMKWREGTDLEFVVLDKDFWSSNELGRVKLEGAMLMPNGYIGTLTLKNLTGGRAGTLQIEVRLLSGDSDFSEVPGIISKHQSIYDDDPSFLETDRIWPLFVSRKTAGVSGLVTLIGVFAVFGVAFEWRRRSNQETLLNPDSDDGTFEGLSVE